MAIQILADGCICCAACEPECPNNAIYDGGENWTLAGVTYGEGDAAPSGATDFWKDTFFYIVPDKCTECVGFHDEPQCIAVCPVDVCVPDPKHVETREQLEEKVKMLDAIDMDRRRD